MCASSSTDAGTQLCCACVQAAQQGDSTKVDKRRKKKQKEQAEDEAFLDNAQDDAEYQQGASGLYLCHTALHPLCLTPIPVSVTSCHVGCPKLNSVFLTPLLTLESQLGGISVSRLFGHMPRNAMHMSTQTLGSLGLMIFKGMHNRLSSSMAQQSLYAQLAQKNISYLNSLRQMVSQSMTEMLAASWLQLG